MPPKAKAPAPKEVIARLTAELEESKRHNVESSKSLLDTNYQLVGTVSSLKDLCMRQQQEFDLQHEVRIRGTQMALAEAQAQLAETAAGARDVDALRAQAEAAREERVVLLRQMGEVTASRDTSEQRHAEEMHSMQELMNSSKAKLNAVFQDSLRSAIADEKKRLAVQLDTESSAALAEVGHLRLLASQQSRQISQLLLVVEDAHKAEDRCKRDAEELGSQVVALSVRNERDKAEASARLREAVARTSSAEAALDVARGEAAKWRATARALHTEGTQLKLKLGMPVSPSVPLDAVAEVSRSSPSRGGSASSVSALVAAGLRELWDGTASLTQVLQAAAGVVEHAVASGHARPSTARRMGAHDRERAGTRPDAECAGLAQAGEGEDLSGAAYEAEMGGDDAPSSPSRTARAMMWTQHAQAELSPRGHSDRPSSAGATRPTSPPVLLASRRNLSGSALGLGPDVPPASRLHSAATTVGRPGSASRPGSSLARIQSSPARPSTAAGRSLGSPTGFDPTAAREPGFSPMIVGRQLTNVLAASPRPHFSDLVR